ncbi:ESX-5 secretion system protein EccC5 [Dissostichus eleginoides]|uniref:ESX-5 secretion system protein EccC5 n=1 Tax=Dissostichus eleginoides TaxID=100907 RepID=A0AAD9BZ51_DISEL|nr:ESX-5 secretion system protein EccC5 [Dissostichus eleginoides]
MQSINWPTPDVTDQRSVVLKGIPIVLGDDSKDFFKTCFDTTRDEALSSVTVGVLTVLSEDSPQEGPSSIQLEPISIDIVLEGGIVMEKIKNFPQAVCLLFGLIYALHFKCRANTLMFVQRVMLGLGTKTLSPKLLTLRNARLD